jgi:hypothetical protein
VRPHDMTKEELKEKISKDLEDHKTEKFFRISDYTNKENESHLFFGCDLSRGSDSSSAK